MSKPQIIKKYPGRRIHCGKEMWFWFVGKIHIVARNGRTGQRRTISIFQLTGVDPTVYRVSVTPKLVASWITLGDDETWTPQKYETRRAMNNGREPEVREDERCWACGR